MTNLSRVVKYRWTTASLCVLVLLGNTHTHAELLQLEPHDHICYLGNTLADRMQHHGWLETLIQSRFTDHQLVFRNLGFSADELGTRPRSNNFGSPDQHLEHSAANVIFLFFGYNESYAGTSGLEAFKAQLIAEIEHLGTHKYDGATTPRIVLLSPIAHENLQSHHLPDGKENNARLQLYVAVMRQVAAAHNRPFVDLFHGTLDLYDRYEEPLTINGIHLNEYGNRRVAELIDQSLFGLAPEAEPALLDRLRSAVIDKNIIWFNRYRATDGYSVFGGRSTLKFVAGQTNLVVMQRELEMLDVMAANRDRRIWNVAGGQNRPIDESNIPSPLKVVSNKPGPNPDGSHHFLSGEAAIEKMALADGLSINLFASEEEFPELVNPVQSAVDPDGRLWVAAWPTYPHWNPREPMDDKLLILEDVDGDGRCDQVKHFANNLHNPTGFEFWGGGVLLAQAPDLMFLKDTDGDDVADIRLRVMHGLDSADTHHTANSFAIGPDGWLYFQRGIFHFTNTETPWGPAFRDTRSAMYRFNPLTSQVEHHFSLGVNPHGITFDRWGNLFGTDGTSGRGYYVGFPGKSTPKELFVKQYRPVPAIGILDSEHFPESLQGRLLVCNVIGFQGVAQYEFVETGAGFHVEPAEVMLTSSDPHFRPSDIRIGGDGAIYILDWQNPLIGHMQHNIRDPNRDHQHGRVYRLTTNGRSTIPPVKMSQLTTTGVVEQLASPTMSFRYRARLELSGRDTDKVLTAIADWIRPLDKTNRDHGQSLLEAIWVHQMHRVPNDKLLRKVLATSHPDVRSAGVRVLRDWQDNISDSDALLLAAANDPHPQVRAEVVVAATYFGGSIGVEALFAVESHPLDQQLTFNLLEAKKMLDLDNYIRLTVDQGKRLSPPAHAYALENADIEVLTKLGNSSDIHETILLHDNANDAVIAKSVTALAQLRKTEEIDVVLRIAAVLDAQGRYARLANLGRWLATRSTQELAPHLQTIKSSVTTSSSSHLRSIGYAAWVNATGSLSDVLEHVNQSAAQRRSLIAALPFFSSSTTRVELFPILQQTLKETPSSHAPDGIASAEAGLIVEFFSPPPQDAKLKSFQTYAPTAVKTTPDIRLDTELIGPSDSFGLRFRGQVIIPTAGQWKFYTTSDDGSRLYIGDQCVVDNDGLHGMRERKGAIDLQADNHPLTITYFENGGSEGLQIQWEGPGVPKQTIPTSALVASIKDPSYDLVIRSLQHIPGHEQQKFDLLGNLLHSGNIEPIVVEAMQSIPVDKWPATSCHSVATSLLNHLTDLSPAALVGEPALELMQLIHQMANRVGSARGDMIRERLAEIRVELVSIGTVPHRMIYDREVIAIQAGSRVAFDFRNTDQMPHNFVIISPGTLEEIGLLAEQTANAKDASTRQYVPKSESVLLASRLLNPGDQQVISFRAPERKGIYPYVCTYPGHWRRMYGALIVVDDLAQYQSNPDQYLTTRAIVPQDEMLLDMGRNREWKVADLTSSIQSISGDRSFTVGKELFRMTTCFACHQMGGEGNAIGPDLVKLDEKLTAIDILKSILTPSTKMDPQFQTYAFSLNDGRIITGMIVKETPTTYQVLANPLDPDQLVTVTKSDIDEQTKSPQSMMPEGLLNKLKEEEILDLVAFVLAKGNDKHTLYAKGHHDH